MPTKPPVALRDVFDDLKPGSSRVAFAGDEAVAPAVKAHIGALEWTATTSALLPKVAELLDIPLPRVFVAFWQGADEIARALKESREAPDDLVEASLLDCSTEATLEPYIEVRLNGVTPGKRLPITVSLPMAFRGVRVTIQNGDFVAVTAGECEIEGSVKLDDVMLARIKEPLTITLGEWQLGEVR
jgi:hypothetical protein